ncbi:ABC transporter ATP-binding protein [Staphylococcus hyicus]|uniref:ABC transporter ATP-binding protein n=1 Tax=Staphylococcus hyicus TaxID=1284 RepID=UPI002738C1FC|nr:ABC transporter ATP-binding protein [Staphylococcus hyicus]MDP4468774.1 ABC transporter ATP-binding protein [Staphylococcus hyicus]MDY3697659.1 ABC transporter ATP-binding protein [Staphylococcus hyicus]
MTYLLKVKNLSLITRNFKILDDINFTISKTSGTVGLIGPNGAGKTTLINGILGQIQPTKGDVFVNLEKIGFCPDVPNFEPFLTPLEILEQTLRLRGIYHKDDIKKISFLLKEVDLIEHKDKIVSRFSRGMKQRLGIASALILDPDIIFLDEPTSALDPFGKKDIYNLIDKISKDRVVVLSSHNLKEIEHNVEDLIVLNKGQLIFEGNIKEFTKKNSDCYDLEFINKAVAKTFYELILHHNIKAIKINEKKIRFDFTEIENVIQLLAPFSRNITKLDVNKFSLNEAFEWHINDAQRGHRNQ